MSATDVLEIVRAALVLIVTVCGPLLLVALVVGVAVSLVQALTQVQEQTLTFVPKIAAMGLTLMVTLPMIGHAMNDFMQVLADHVTHG